MTSTALALFGYIAWTLILLLIMEIMRCWLVLSGRRSGDDFRPDGSDVSLFAHRLARAHANCYESFPVFGGLLLLALAAGLTHITDALALWLLAARVAQSSVHLISTSTLAIRVRFTFFAVQMAIAVVWVVQMARAALG